MIYKWLLFLPLWASLLFGQHIRIITMEHNPNVGMFATANQILGELHLFETGQLPQVSALEVDFRTNGLYYDESHGPNWWNYFFEPIYVGEKTNVITVYPTKEDCFLAWSHRRQLTKKQASELVKKYIHIQPHILLKIDAFIAEHFRDHYMIGVHFRGTDKAVEAPRVDYEIIFKEIRSYLPLDKSFLLFIATDEINFLEQAKLDFPGHVIALDAHRTEHNKGIHFENKNNYCIGEEAIMDAYLLSRCNLLIRTSSNLSLWSTFFNPELPVILLNHRYMDTLEPE